MKKTAVLMIVLMVSVLASVAVAGDKGAGMVGRLFLFQKCDPSLAPQDTEEATEEDAVAEYDENGCPIAEGPWPIFPDNRRWGQMKYNILGPEFRYSFQGKNLDPGNYTLIYYPDPWPGEDLICLGTGKVNTGGNIQIHGSMEIPGGLPQPNDANYKPAPPSGAVGAKIWLVLSEDVQCESVDVVDENGEPVLDEEDQQVVEAPQLLKWNPGSYLFEGNLIIYQPMDALDKEDDGSEDGSVDNGVEGEEEQESEEEEAPEIKNNNGKAYGKDKQK